MIRTEYELAVIGGGPAGLAAATLAGELGLDTVLFDEHAMPGGQIYRNIETVARSRARDLDLLGPDYHQGLNLVERFRQSAAAYEPGSIVWQALPDGKLGVSRDGASSIVRTKRIIIATGAMERPVPIPGWTLPGVMAAGAVQTLLKSSSHVPDVPTVIAGSGPLVYLVAWQLARAGAPLAAVLHTTPRNQLMPALSKLPRALLAGTDLWNGLAWIRYVRSRGIPVMSGVTCLVAEGKERVEAVSFECGREKRRIAAGLLLLHEGVVPNSPLSLAAGCHHFWDEAQQCWRPETDAWGTTSLERISVAGDAAGISGAKAAVPLGRLATLDAACRLGRIDRVTRDRAAHSERSALARHLRIRPFLDQLFRPHRSVSLPTDDNTIVCRCEEVTVGDLRRAVTQGYSDPNQVKAFTRCGMGLCQGRMCGLTLSQLIARQRSVPVGDVGYYRVRVPVRPLSIAELARLDNAESESPVTARDC